EFVVLRESRCPQPCEEAVALPGRESGHRPSWTRRSRAAGHSIAAPCATHTAWRPAPPDHSVAVAPLWGVACGVATTAPPAPTPPHSAPAAVSVPSTCSCHLSSRSLYPPYSTMFPNKLLACNLTNSKGLATRVIASRTVNSRDRERSGGQFDRREAL